MTAWNKMRQWWVVMRQVWRQSPTPTRATSFPRPLLPTPLDELTLVPVLPGRRLPVRADVVIVYHPANLPYLQESVYSILHQAAADCVIHLVADQVPLETDPVFPALQSHPQLRFYQTTRALGPYRATNCLFPHLETDFLVVQDSDDIALPNRVWRSVQLLQQTGADIVGGSMEQFVDHRSAEREFFLRKLEESPFHLSGVRWQSCPTGAVIHGTMTIRKSTFAALNGYADLDCSADSELCVRAHHAGVRIQITEQIMGLRRLHGSSMTGGTFRFGGVSSREINARLLEQYPRYASGAALTQFGSLDRYRGGSELIKREALPVRKQAGAR